MLGNLGRLGLSNSPLGGRPERAPRGDVGQDRGVRSRRAPGRRAHRGEVKGNVLDRVLTLSGYQLLSYGLGRRVSAVASPEFYLHFLEVTAHGLFTDAEPLRDVIACHP